jgi:hypothetical protein
VRLLRWLAIAQLAPRQIAVLATLVREPKFGDNVAVGLRFGKIDVVTRFKGRGDQVRVRFGEQDYETYRWDELTWGRGLWEAKRDPP